MVKFLVSRVFLRSGTTGISRRNLLQIVLFASVFTWCSVSAVFAEPESEVVGSKAGTYQEIGKQKGVFWNGQAAPWDLDIFDHFHYFGPKERAKGHKPKQPIAFSHVTHVQKNKIDCQFCHWSVAKSPYANIPELETCLGCHKLVGGTTPEQQTEISKLRGYCNGEETLQKAQDEHSKLVAEKGAEAAGALQITCADPTCAEGDPIPWVKVHVMPDHVRFNHKRHVKAGVACHECHGQIQEMEVVERVSSMKMGWCVSCHRERGTSIDCYVCHK